MFAKIYKTLIIDFSKISIVVICSIFAFLLYFSKDFKLDASSDSLLLENDKDLKYLREVSERYGSKDYLVLTYTPVSSFTDEETKICLAVYQVHGHAQQTPRFTTQLIKYVHVRHFGKVSPPCNSTRR